ncbi:MAG: hypothetical protein VX460_10015 [Planctomycetota bacterium]|nr:hypothetical protein [Planctomycetota bacterium]
MTSSDGSSAPDPLEDAQPGFPPDLRVHGEVQVPTSKSIAQRVLACALLAEGETRFEALPTGMDVLHALRCARAGGARFPSDGKTDDLLATALIPRVGRGALIGAPPGPAERARPWVEFPVGESGTSARMFTAIAALGRPAGSGAEVVPSGTLARRRSAALFRALRAAGAGVEHGGIDDGWPALLTAASPPDQLELVEPGSSQEVTSLLIALASHGGHRELRVVGQIPSEGYVGITTAVLERFGAVITTSAVLGDGPTGDATRFTVRGPLRAPLDPIRIEADASSAAVALAAGALSGGGRTVVRGVGVESAQPDAAFPRLMARLGCDASLCNSEQLALSGEPTVGGVLDCSACPDVAPVLAAVGGFLAERGEGLELTGLETLPGKESSRIDVLAAGLRAIGFEVDATDRSLKVHRRAGRPTAPVVLDPHGDHRMVFAFSLMSLFEPHVRILDPNCVSKSWPSFWRDLSTAGG